MGLLGELKIYIGLVRLSSKYVCAFVWEDNCVVQLIGLGGSVII